MGAPTTHELISQANGCTEYNEKTMVDSMNDVTEYMSTSCVNNASVTLYALKGVGHNPYMGDGELSPVNVDTTQKAWDFMKQYSLETAPDLIVNIIEDPMSLEPSSRPSALVTGFRVWGQVKCHHHRLGLFQALNRVPRQPHHWLLMHQASHQHQKQTSLPLPGQLIYSLAWY